MNITSRARYAVTALLDLAQQPEAGPVALGTIGARQGLSVRYLEQLFCQLRQAGLVASARGPGGGYRLARPPAQISVADVVAAVECPPKHQDCAGQVHQALVDEFWMGLSDCMRDYLSGATLASLRDCVTRAARQQEAAQ